MLTVHNFRTKYWVSSIQLEDSTAKRWDVGCFTYLDGVLAIFSCTLWYSCKLHRRPSFVVSRLMLEMWFTSCSPVKKEIVILFCYWLHAGCHYRFKVTKQPKILQSSGRFIAWFWHTKECTPQEILRLSGFSCVRDTRNRATKITAFI